MSAAAAGTGARPPVTLETVDAKLNHLNKKIKPSCCHWRIACIALAVLGIAALAVGATAYSAPLDISSAFGAVTITPEIAKWILGAGLVTAIGLTGVLAGICKAKEKCCSDRNSVTV